MGGDGKGGKKGRSEEERGGGVTIEYMTIHLEVSD